MSSGPPELITPESAPDDAAEDLTAADVMRPVLRTCSPFSTVTEAVLIFKEHDSDVVPVVDAGKPLGVVVDRDVALAVADTPDLGAQPVSEIMVQDFPLIPVDAHVDQVLQTMSASGARLALVTDASELLVGLIFWSDLAQLLPSTDQPSVNADDATLEAPQP